MHSKPLLHRGAVCATLLGTLLALHGPAQARRESLSKVAKDYLDAVLFKGDKAAANKLLLTHKELSRMTKKSVSAQEYNKEIKRWLGRFLGGLKGKRGLKLHGVEIVDVMLLPEGSEKNKVELVWALVKPIFMLRGKTKESAWPYPFNFVKVKDRWKVAVKH
jgi:hypothetical protein